MNPHLRTVCSPYPDAEELLAVPAIRLDAALVHLNRADAAGNAQFLGPDLYFGDLFCTAAERAYVSCERVVPTAELAGNGARTCPEPSATTSGRSRRGRRSESRWCDGCGGAPRCLD